MRFPLCVVTSIAGLAYANVASTATATTALDRTSEPEPIVAAAALVQPALLSGPNFRVVPETPVRGYMAHFLVDTPYGPLHADSVELLALRESEIPALEALDRASRTGAFTHALAQR